MVYLVYAISIWVVVCRMGSHIDVIQLMLSFVYVCFELIYDRVNKLTYSHVYLGCYLNIYTLVAIHTMQARRIYSAFALGLPQRRE